MAKRDPQDRLLSVEEYVRFELASPVKHEYVAGEIFAMTGSTRRHNRIAGNIYRLLSDAAEGGPCRVAMTEVRLRASKDIFYYPDVMVACGAEPDDPYVEEAPCLVVEVLSPSTSSIDRREKLLVYRQIPSLEAYLIVDQDQPRIQRHWKDEQGAWHAEEVSEGMMPVPCPPLVLALEEVYRGVSFDD